MQYKLVSDLIRIASAGGGLELDAALRPTSDLIRIAAAANAGGGLVFLRGMTHRPTSDMIRIASASGGKVIFCA